MYLIGRKRVEILAKYDHSYLVRYVKTGVESSVSKSLVRKWTPKEHVPVLKKETTKTNINQLNLFNE